MTQRIGPAPQRYTTVPQSSLDPVIAAAQRNIRARANTREQNANTLRQYIGRPDFYAQMARLDPAHANDWNRMVSMQSTFRAGESGYDGVTRTYSESMRESLHRGVIELYRRQPLNRVYDDFIGMHAALFRENGAFSGQISRSGVVSNTEVSQVLRNGRALLEGASNLQNYGPLARQVAEETRVARERRGLPITPR